MLCEVPAVNVEFVTPSDRDEQVVYMSDHRGWFTYKEGKPVWSVLKAPVCRIPGPVVIEIQRRLGVEHPKGVIQ